MAKRKEADINTEAAIKAYTPKPSVKEEAVKYLKSKGYQVEFKDGLIYGLFSSEEEYKLSKKILTDKYGDGKTIPFSFGGRIGDISQLTKQTKHPEFEEKENSSEENV